MGSCKPACIISAFACLLILMQRKLKPASPFPSLYSVPCNFNIKKISHLGTLLGFLFSLDTVRFTQVLHITEVHFGQLCKHPVWKYRSLSISCPACGHLDHFSALLAPFIQVMWCRTCTRWRWSHWVAGHWTIQSRRSYQEFSKVDDQVNPQSSCFRMLGAANRWRKSL